jgi:fumarate hydratase class II
VSFANWQREHDISGHLRAVIAEIAACRAGLYQIESSGTVVGTDLDARKGLAREVVARIADLTGKPFVSGHEGSAVQNCTDAMVRAHRALRKLAIALMNAVNGMRRFASSSHSSLEGSLLSNSELYPATDEVSSTRCEAIVTTCIQVIGNDCAVFFAGSLGHFGIDTMRPVIVNNLMRSACNLTDGLGAFREFLGEGGEFNNHNAQQYADDVLALMTDIPLMSDYKDEAHLVGSASTHDLKLKPGSLVTSAVNRALFDESVKPVNIVSHGLG